MSVVVLLLACGWTSNLAPVRTAEIEAEKPYPQPKEYVKEVFSGTYHIDKKYRSMVGPDGRQDVYLHNSKEPELLWITGYETYVVDADSKEKVSQEFMCHANLDFDATRYYELMDTEAPLSGRVFTLSQGQQDIEFPDGMGIPILSTQPLSLTTQVLNLNLPSPDMNVKHAVRIEYVRDHETTEPMLPLFQSAVEGFKALESAQYYGMANALADPDTHGEGCSVGMPALEGDFDEDALGQKFTAHWVVPPGREVNRTNVTRFLNQRFDTTAHYIAVHLHPTAETLELIDLTTGETVFKSGVVPAEGRIGIERVEYFRSREGLKIYKDHEYELVSVYNNTTGEEVDSMAVMYMYMHDRSFQKPFVANKPEPAG